MTKTSATHSRICAAKAGLAVLALGVGLAAMPALAQNQPASPPRGLDNEPDVRDVALTPLSDLNLNRDPIPEILVAARNAPYDEAGLRNCGDVLRMVGDLDAVLGEDYDLAPPDERRISPGNLAQRIVGSFIPFRGIIREISGANEHERDFREAIAAGMMRRAYLKGRGQAMGCAYPARPATPQQAAEWAAARAAAEQAGEDDDDRRRNREREREREREEDNGSGFYSEPVVQDVS